MLLKKISLPKNFLSSFFFCVTLIISLFFTSTVLASSQAPKIKDENYQGKFVSQSVPDPLVMKVGESKEVEITFQNSGKNIWKKDGANFVSMYTTIPSYRDSLFYQKNSWLSPHQPARLLKETNVKQKAVFKIVLQAPTQTGEYTERFQLAAENKSWIKGTGFFLKIKVIASDSKNYDVPLDKPDTSSGDNPKLPSPFLATPDAPSPMFLQGVGGESTRVVLDFKNSGTSTWENYQLNEFNSRYARNLEYSNGVVSFFDNSWSASSTVVQGDSVVEPGEHLRIEFTLRNPPKRGEYVAGFALKINGQNVSGGVVNIPAIVTTDNANSLETTATTSRVLISEPQIRVGLYKTPEPVKFVSEFNYNVYSGSELKGVLSAGSMATLHYENGTYFFKSADLDFSSSNYLRLVPDDLTNFFTIKNYERKLSGRSINFNSYRGVLEYRYSPKSALPYIINELPLDEYVQATGETSDGAPAEYNKALLVAIRSYAFYHLSRSAAAPGTNMFDVSPTTADQLYLGYNIERSMPNVLLQTAATHGEMVTYNGSPVVTPYFSRSDGRTRSWKEVWGGDYYPWLQSVETIYDQGKKMLGHGVGMSGADAIQRAKKDGWTYDQILKYYYTGVNVEKIF
jgi:hypothetical protein